MRLKYIEVVHREDNILHTQILVCHVEECF